MICCLLNCYLSFSPFPILKVSNLIHMLFLLFSADRTHQYLLCIMTSLNTGLPSCSTLLSVYGHYFTFFYFLCCLMSVWFFFIVQNLFFQSGSLEDVYFFLGIKEFYQNIHRGMWIPSPLPPSWTTVSCISTKFKSRIQWCITYILTPNAHPNKCSP